MARTRTRSISTCALGRPSASTAADTSAASAAPPARGSSSSSAACARSSVEAHLRERDPPLRRRVEERRAAEVAAGRRRLARGRQALADRRVEHRAVPAVLLARGHVRVLDDLALASRADERGRIEVGRLIERRPGPRRSTAVAGDARGLRRAGGLLRLRDGRGRRRRVRERAAPEQDRRQDRGPHARTRSRASRRSASSSVASFLQNAKRTCRRPCEGSR